MEINANVWSPEAAESAGEMNVSGRVYNSFSDVLPITGLRVCPGCGCSQGCHQESILARHEAELLCTYDT